MAHLESGYYQAPLHYSESTGGRHWFRVSVALVGGSCLAFLCICATLQSISTPQSTSTDMSIRMFNPPIAKSGIATGQSANGMHHRQVFRPSSQKLPNQLWQSRMSVKGKADTAATAPTERSLSAFERISRIAGAASSLGYLKFPSPFSRPTAGQVIEPKSLVWSPGDSPVGVTWGFLDDMTFGGNSESSFDATTGTWSGSVEYNPPTSAGFASIRTPLLDPSLDLTSCTGLRLKVKGQGQRLKFLVRDDKKFNGVSWSYAFNTNPWFDTEVKIRFDDFVPVRDAQSQDASPLDVSSITVFQLIYSRTEYDKSANPTFKEGNFQIVLKEINTF
eukprot:gnl/MRDRNA2_/MRDRNA2_92405_c0_seq1.p1 gnl/MRDRNA2_/MRDRNA2_92405_c0~~gnl/MRDRNA2_/MRDRNA2_92405_c0_seq1.p1  ORF type:complete len:354 (-),score=48.19 gnl/MRDRNA2_/MRDRNA2_92405_c0_seq1:26-1024(-)